MSHSKIAKYNDWIKENVDQDCLGKCKEMAEIMLETFLELRMVRGHYYCPVWGERGHWWLIDENDDIVDPTRSQFPSKGLGLYVEWDEFQKEPTGKCPNCGGYCYDGRDCCSDNCYTEFVASLVM